MDSSVWVAIISGVLTLAGVLVSNGSTRAALEQKVDDLSGRVDKHNRVIERTYALETAVQRHEASSDERFKTVFNELAELKGEINRKEA